ncbi:MAG: energy-coupling factor transporter transmembrane protein EcfT, partial [Clostridia bacterium]|nr:energy-coupling factor transporter transmembrane protein EcfT [Clostridia bacterium]
FIGGAFLLLGAIGCYRACLRVFPVTLIFACVFGGISYLARRDVGGANAMGVRLLVIGTAVIPGMSVAPVDLTRNLNQMKAPKGVTLGMLIALNFTPLLRLETKRVREAMKTRGAGSLLSPKVFYRAFLIPFVTRIVNISDTLALSVETRGFSLEKTQTTVYKTPKFKATDAILILGLVAGAIITVAL